MAERSFSNGCHSHILREKVATGWSQDGALSGESEHDSAISGETAFDDVRMMTVGVPSTG